MIVEKVKCDSCAHPRYCGQPAVYLWAGQLPLCEPCAVSAGLKVGQEARPGGGLPAGPEA